MQGATITVDHHAVLFGLLARGAISALGYEAADEWVSRAVKHYGHQRGHRIALHAQKHGWPLDMVSYFGIKEWTIEDGAPNESKEGACEAYHVGIITRCRWTQVWRKYHMEDVANWYCRDIDVALLHGFNPDLRLEVRKSFSRGDACCEFHWMDAHRDPAVRACEKERGRIAQARRDWDYHTAHLYRAFADVFAPLGQTGQEALQTAKASFVELFGTDAWQAVEALTSLDFDAIAD